MEETETEQKTKWHLPKREIIVGSLAAVVTIALCVVAIIYKDEIVNVSNIGSYGLLGVLVVAFVAGSTLSITAIPIPYWIVVFTLPSILAEQWGVFSPIWVGLVSALGCTLGHLPTFMIGYGGRSLSQRLTSRLGKRLERIYRKAIGWAERHGAWAIFLMSAVLNPLHLPMTIAIGTLHYPPWKYLVFAFLGNSVKSLVIAFGGYYGLNSLFGFLGV